MYSPEGYLLWWRTAYKFTVSSCIYFKWKIYLSSWLHFENLEHEMNDALPVDTILMELA